MKIPKLKLYTKILVGLILGVVVGILLGPKAAVIKPIGTAFIRLITLIVVPLVFASLLVGTASLGDIRKLGRMGMKTITYYLTTTALAITIGLLLANIIRPGSRLPDEVKTNLLQNYGGVALEKIQQAEETPGVIDVLLDIIPTNPVNSLNTANMLQIIFFAVLLGIALTMIPSHRARSVLAFFEGINDAMIQIVHIVMKLAPYGVFALIAAIVGEFGAGILLTLARYSIVVIIGLILHTCLTYPAAVGLLAKMNPLTFFRGIRPAQLIAFSTSSSSATLPVTMECSIENLNVPNDVASFVLPLGATINMDGTALYQGVAAVFISEVYGMHLTLGNQLMIVLTATLASIGAAGVPGVGMITLALVLKTIGVPLEGIALILGVDRILDMCRTVTNISGDSSAAVIVAATEGELGTSRSFDYG
ncbi:MAG: dicarboxylate/amino acid:cation symporter [Gemmatimonadota bacterium]|nr:MAG: dicarboxylate/amino acid:cation symporter [Gemmatimonadota bacterium]